MWCRLHCSIRSEARRLYELALIKWACPSLARPTCQTDHVVAHQVCVRVRRSRRRAPDRDKRWHPGASENEHSASESVADRRRRQDNTHTHNLTKALRRLSREWGERSALSCQSVSQRRLCGRGGCSWTVPNDLRAVCTCENFHGRNAAPRRKIWELVHRFLRLQNVCFVNSRALATTANKNRVSFNPQWVLFLCLTSRHVAIQTLFDSCWEFEQTPTVSEFSQVPRAVFHPRPQTVAPCACDDYMRLGKTQHEALGFYCVCALWKEYNMHFLLFFSFVCVVMNL